MKISLLLYNLFLLTLYVIPSILAVIFWLDTKKTIYIYIGTLFLLYSIDNCVVYMTESFEHFSNFYDSMFMVVPSFTTIIFVGCLFCMLQINQIVLNQKHRPVFSWGLVILVFYLMFLPMLKNSAFKVWCYYTPIQVYSFVLGLYGLSEMNKTPRFYPFGIEKKYRRLLLWTAIFSVLIIVEDTIVIFIYDVYTDMSIEIHNRSFTLNLLSIYYSMTAISILWSILMERLRETKAAEDVKASEDEVDSDIRSDAPSEMELEASVTSLNEKISDNTENDFSKFYLFCRKYQLTIREQDILALLLENKNNQEISDELFISIGTAKAHVHNIFSKADIKKRQQLIDLYQDFQEEQED